MRLILSVAHDDLSQSEQLTAAEALKDMLMAESIRFKPWGRSRTDLICYPEDETEYDYCLGLAEVFAQDFVIAIDNRGNSSIVEL